MSEALPVDAVALRDEVRAKYRDVAVNPRGGFHFHTGRPLARRLGYDEDVIARMPETAIEAFAGVGNPFSQGTLHPGERVVDLGSGGGFDCFVAAGQVGPEGHVVGVDMTDEMLERSRATASSTSVPTSVVSSTRLYECCARGDGCSSPTSPPARLCRKRPSATSICGPTELPVPCRAQAGGVCWKKAGSSRSI